MSKPTYFSFLPNSEFRASDSEGDLYDVSLKDLFVRYKIRSSVLKSTAIFYPYTWKDSDRPDTVAKNYYGDEKYYWVVFLSNQSSDFYRDFAKPQAIFIEYLQKKYASLYFPNIDYKLLSPVQRQTIIDNLQSDVSFYRTPDKLIIDQDTFTSGAFPGSTAVTLFQEEDEKNEAKRLIRLIDRSYLQQIVSEYEAEIRTRRQRGR